jgi:hypothetical protein
VLQPEGGGDNFLYMILPSGCAPGNGLRNGMETVSITTDFIRMTPF